MCGQGGQSRDQIELINSDYTLPQNTEWQVKLKSKWMLTSSAIAGVILLLSVSVTGAVLLIVVVVVVVVGHCKVQE
jgi:hypothetical protein